MLVSSVLFCCFVFSINALCSWNRAAQAVDNDNAATMNFVNGEWERVYNKTSGETLNGQAYWKKEQYDNCYVDTLWLYYYKGQDYNDYQWLIAPYWNVSPTSAYVRCSLGMIYVYI